MVVNTHQINLSVPSVSEQNNQEFKNSWRQPNKHGGFIRKEQRVIRDALKGKQ